MIRQIGRAFPSWEGQGVGQTPLRAAMPQPTPCPSQEGNILREA